MAVKKNQVIPLREHVQKTIRQYLEDMGSTEPEHVYRRLLSEIEPPLIEEVLRYDSPIQALPRSAIAAEGETE